MKLKLLVIVALVFGLCLLGCEGPAGVNGTNGDDGANGSNSTEQGDKGDKGQTGPAGPQGPDGADYDGDATAADGHDGPRGFDGASVIIMGAVETEADLPPEGGGVTLEITEAWIVGGYLYVWDRTNEDWINTHQPVRGDRGEQGDKGEKGDKGEIGGDPVEVCSVEFDPDNGIGAPNVVTVIKGGKIIPVSPAAAKTLAQYPLTEGGLYRDTYTFTGWYETDDEGVLADDPWDFNYPFEQDTKLTAGWISPALVQSGKSTVITGTATTAITDANFVASAFSYMNEGTASKAGSYILYLDKDYSASGGLSLNVLNYGQRNLKIIALQDDDDETPEVERIITLNNNNGYIQLSGNSMTLSENVTVKGTATHTYPLFYLQSTSVLTMEDGSKITGNTNTTATTATVAMNAGKTAGVFIWGGTFIMKPGSEISDMAMSNIGSSAAGIAIYIGNQNTGSVISNQNAIIMEGGEIKNCTGEGLANVYIQEDWSSSANLTSLTLSGDASPGSIMMGTGYMSTDASPVYVPAPCRPIAIDADWTGSIERLDLRAPMAVTYNNTTRIDVIAQWFNSATPADSPVFVTGTFFDGDGDPLFPLGNFVAGTITREGGNIPDSIVDAIGEDHTGAFRDSYELGTSGKLVKIEP